MSACDPKRTTDDYLDDQDAIQRWIDECVKREPLAFTTTAKLFKSWKTWCERANHYQGTEAAFADELVEKGFERHRKEFGRGFKGIMLAMIAEMNFGNDGA